MTAPRVQAFVLADAVYRDRATGKHVVAGTFTRLVARAFPCDFVRPVDAYVALVGLEGTCAVALRFAADDEVLRRSTALEVTGRDPRDVIEVVFPIPSLPLPRAGWYRLEVLVDDVVLGDLGLVARLEGDPAGGGGDDPFAIHLR